MARPLRIELAGGFYHVTARGNVKDDIYLDDEDRLLWLSLLGSVCKRFNWRGYAYCLMTNHYHIIIQTMDANLSKGMRQLNGVYTQTFNRRHSRVGHIFQGRYKAILVQKNAYLLELARYVVLNPVRAEMVDAVQAWPWSSYAATINQSQRPEWLYTKWILKQFGTQQEQAIKGYINFVRAGVGLPTIWENLKGQIYLGDEHFIRKMQDNINLNQLSQIEEIPRIQRRPPAKPLTHYVEKFADAKQGMQKAYQTGDYTMQQIAAAFKVHYSTVSRAVKQGENT
jgi:REP-associated tyrosine transposase